MRTTQRTWQLGITIFLAAGLLASPAFAQSWGDEPTRSTSRSSPSRGGSSQSLVGGSMRSQQQFEGAYVQFGASAGRIDLDDVKGVGGRNIDVETEASGGFTMTGGYRFLPWLAAEANFSFMQGREVEILNVDVGDEQAFAFNFGPKVYPFALSDRPLIPDAVQPYGLIGIGGGEAEVDAKGNNRDIERSSFTARFVLGFDLWFTDNIGAFTEGGYQVWDDDAVIGVGIWSIGAQYRF